MDKELIISKTIDFVKNQLRGDSTGHDWWHIYRVWKMAAFIGVQEEADLFVIQLAALLHDIADWKFQDGDDAKGAIVASEFLKSLKVDAEIIDHVVQIMQDISFKGSEVQTDMKTLEGKVVQDADRLDAIGAIGIARSFAYGGYKGREMHNPVEKPVLHQSFEHYKLSQSTTINHFYEKLLLLKDRMNTSTAKKIALERHLFLETFLEQFMKEWNFVMD